MIRHRFRAPLAALVFVFAALLSLRPGPAAALAETPEEVINHFHSVIVSVMKDAQKLGYEGRVEALRPALMEDFNLRGMARTAVGRYWKAMTDEQRQRFVEVFKEFSVANYANRFNDYGGESFKTLETKEVGQGAVLVYTVIVKSDGEDVEINYLMQKAAERWQVIDVYLTGAISELATRRSEYTAIIRRDGVDRLIAEIESKTQELAQQ